MALFDRFRLTQGEVERPLTRPLTGDPTKGEKGVLMAINAKRLADARRLLERDSTVAADARELFERHLQEQAARWERLKIWSVSLPLPIWDEYARESRLNNASISRCLTGAIRRDYERRMAAFEPANALRAEVRAYHKTQQQMLEAVQVLTAIEKRGILTVVHDSCLYLRHHPRRRRVSRCSGEHVACGSPWASQPSRRWPCSTPARPSRFWTPISAS